MIITLTDKDLQTDLTDSGQVIDVLALSLNQWTENEVWENNIDYEHYSTDYVIENYDFEKAFIDYLNTGGVLQDITNPDIVAEAEKSELKDGAFYALNYPDEFAQALEDWTSEVKDACLSYYDEPKNVPKDLIKELQDAVDSFHEDQHREWLYGDHRDFAGILSMAERKYGVTDVTVDQTANEVYFELDDDEAREIIRGNSYDYDDEKVDKMSGTKLEKATKEQLADWINSQANSVVAKKRAEIEKRREEYAKTKAYQEQRKAQAEVERKEKLLQMTK